MSFRSQQVPRTRRFASIIPTGMHSLAKSKRFGLPPAKECPESARFRAALVIVYPGNVGLFRLIEPPC